MKTSLCMLDTEHDMHDRDCEAIPYPKQDDAPSHYTQGDSQLDLISGSYDVETSINDEWSEYKDHQFTVTIPYDGEIWDAYDLGIFEVSLFHALKLSVEHCRQAAAAWDDKSCESTNIMPSLGVLRSFPIKAGFIVSISGGVWGYKTDVQLVDVVISGPDGSTV
ncbi:hypothetical protein B0A55_10766 [Friedmanniomyces simplex]|uniref:Uncharacterized protein n=1 Tax=Friedmanniomyces simplex TaxID=329884 RepID=A0A4U0X6X1_9PEZI|nr:hypothetical protein B0A55_10766 [Friedmanniomyces simplex]